MPSALEIVREIPDTALPKVAADVFSAVYTAVPYGAVRAHSESFPDLAALLSLDDGALKADLTPADSARLARLVLEEYARDPALAPFVERACGKVLSSDKMFIGEVLALGMLVNLTLLVATTEIHVQKGKDGKTIWTYTKRKAGPQLVKSVVGAVTSVAKIAS